MLESSLTAFSHVSLELFFRDGMPEKQRIQNHLTNINECMKEITMHLNRNARILFKVIECPSSAQVAKST